MRFPIFLLMLAALSMPAWAQSFQAKPGESAKALKNVPPAPRRTMT